MPKISELDNAAVLDGTELIDLVQNGVNVKVPLKMLMNAPRDVSASNARWIQFSSSTDILDTPTLEIGPEFNEFPVLTAKADILCNHNNIIRWSHEFAGIQEPANDYFDLVCNGLDQPNPFHAGGGEYIITLESGSATFEVDGVSAALGDLTVPYGQEKVITVHSESPGVIRITQTLKYSEVGSEPETFATGDQLTLRYTDQPRGGLFTARAVVLSATGNVLATSNDITLTIVIQQAQGS